VLLFDAERKFIGENNEGMTETLYGKRVNVLHRYEARNLLVAGTVLGIFTRPIDGLEWERATGVDETIISIYEYDESLFAIGESNAFRYDDGNFVVLNFGRDVPGKPRIPLVSYLFDVHTGRILGIPGRLMMDIGGLVLATMSVSGFYMWIVPRRLKTRFANSIKKITLRYHIRHYKRFGKVLLVVAAIFPLTGLFMQAPFIAVLAGRTVRGRFHVDPPDLEGWNRSVDYAIPDLDRNVLYVVAGLRIYEGSLDFSHKFTRIESVVPVHPMGVTHLSRFDDDDFLVASFAGLLRWNVVTDIYTKFDTGAVVSVPQMRIPKDGYQVTGVIPFEDGTVLIDFRKGAIDFGTDIPFFEMPESYQRRSIFSFWHYLFEVHNGRVWRGVVGGFYIFHTMLVAFSASLLLWTGVSMVLKRRKKRIARSNRKLTAEI
jgi:hypothetical protein